MRQIFKSTNAEQFFRKNGYFVIDLLEDSGIDDLISFCGKEFENKREVFPFAENLHYYISIFDKDQQYKERVDRKISGIVSQKINQIMVDYEVFYSNFMIKFPGDGQIEAHQDFNFVDETVHTAFNLWSPMVNTNTQNGALFVIPGSHRVFKSQRGPNIPRALTQYNEIMKRYAIMVPLKKGQAVIFDHKLVHYSPPNYTDIDRVAIQSVLKPLESPALHYFYNKDRDCVQAYRVDKKYVLENNLWEPTDHSLELDHEQSLIPFPDENEIIEKLVSLKLDRQTTSLNTNFRKVFKKDEEQEQFEQNGFVKLPLLEEDEVLQLRKMFYEFSSGDVKNTDYGIYISLEEEDIQFKKDLIKRVSKIVLPKAEKHFKDCKPHLGSFLVKAPGEFSHTYPHQDWTFMGSPEYFSVTVWVALVDTDEQNGTLGFVKGSQHFFDKPIGSPSPDFQTYTQGHEDIFYEYLQFVPLKAGEAVVFDNRTIHGAPPNLSDEHRVAVAIGMTPKEAPLYHHFLYPGSSKDGRRRIAKLKVNQEFFSRYTIGSLKKIYEKGELPADYEVESSWEEEFNPYSRNEIQAFCEHSRQKKNGRNLLNESSHNSSNTMGDRGFIKFPVVYVKRLINFFFKH